ncbi:MAG: HAD family hydrolase [Candidatus Aenigmarchaeota archaeon]|nr:HAD family hydrolase [Candidatus Aenigmarchaeota archaeon]
MIKAILFDVDGTIYDNNEQIIEFHKKTAKELGLKGYSDVDIYKHMGKGWDEIIDLLWPEVENQKFKEKYWKLKEKLEFTLRFNGDVKPVIEFLRTKYKIGVVSGGSKVNIETKFRNHDIFHFFDVIVGEEDTKKHKPFGEPLLKACEELKIKPEEAIYIGDSINDYKAAKEAGVPFIGFIWDGINYNIFKDVELKNSVKNFEDIPEEIEKIIG